MPLLDHFHPPLSRSHPWRGFHATWAVAIARILNAGVLPNGYYAVPFRDERGPIEIDVAALHNGTPDSPDESRVWKPVAPELTVAVEWPSAEESRVEIRSDDGDPELVAAVELVSPRNKDWASARKAFVAKCADYLRRSCGLVVVDVVTSRRADLRSELFAELEIEAPEPSSPLSAVAYRPVAEDSAGRLMAWPSELRIGESLPTLPLWLDERAVPLELETSHHAACIDVAIRQAG